MLRIGYITCPSDITVKDYIDTCFKTETVSIIDDRTGQVHHDCKINKSTLQEIEFPNVKENELMGSLVVWGFVQDTLPIVIGSFSRNDELDLVLPSQQRLFKRSGENYGSVTVDGKNSTVTVTSGGSGRSEVIIRAASTGQEATVTIESSGNISIRSKDSISIESNSISLGTENLEPSVLGVTLKEKILHVLIEHIKKIKVPTAFGPSGYPLNNLDFKQLDSKLDIILSKINTLE